jgi:hypothetical protein
MKSVVVTTKNNPPLFDRLRPQAEAILRDLRDGAPGDRFFRYWRLRHLKNKNRPIRRALLIVVGILLVVVGAVLGPTPIVPGFVIGVPGLAILAAQLRFLSKAIDKAELILRRLFFTSK